MLKMYTMTDKEAASLDLASRLNIAPMVAKHLQTLFLDATPGQGKPRFHLIL
jgi:hypothetical protein